jgi:predicted P-loop ATPase
MSHDLSKPLAISLFTSEKDNAPKTQEFPWSKLCSDFDEREVKSGPCWSPATFNGSRAIRNVISLSCLVFDLDQPMTDELANSLETLNYIAHTTHTPGRWRVIVKTSRPHTAAEHKKLWLHVHNNYGLGLFDEKCTDASRIYYWPAKRPGQVSERHDNLNGKVIDVDEVLVKKPAVEVKPRIDVPFDLEAARKKAKQLNDPARRELLTNLLTCEWGPSPGGRSNDSHRALSLLATVINPSDDVVDMFINCMLDNMDVEPEGREHWFSNFRSSYERGQTFNAEVKAEREAIKEALVAKGIEAGEDEGWREKLLYKTNKDGEKSVRPLGLNVELILRHDHRLKNLRFNTVTREVEAEDTVLKGANMNIVDTMLTNWLQREYSLTIGRQEVMAQIALVLAERSYDPLKAWLEGLKWDGVERITKLLRKRCNVTGNNDFYVDNISRRFFIGAAARGMNPGIQMDNVLILTGKGGIGKTSFVRTLGGAFAAQTTLDLGNKDALQIVAGRWMVELAELSSWRKSDQTHFRAFVTMTTDTFRPPYGRVPEEYKRRCVFVGTSNEDETIDDLDGLRRYWSVRCGDIDLKWLAENREQIWAEAAQAAKAGERYWFTPEEQEKIKHELALHQTTEPVVEVIESWFNRCQKDKRPKSLNMMEMMNHLGFVGADVTNKGLQASVGKAMKQLGFVKKRDNFGRRGTNYTTPQELLTGEVRRFVQVVPAMPAAEDKERV